MSMERKGELRDSKWENYRKDFFSRHPELLMMLKEKMITVEWNEDVNKRPDHIKVFYTNEKKPFIFENIKSRASRSI